MSGQSHKNFVGGQVKLLLKSYINKEIKINCILSILGIKRKRFFKLLARYKKIRIISLSNIAEKQLIVKYIKLLRINLQEIEVKGKTFKKRRVFERFIEIKKYI